MEGEACESERVDVRGREEVEDEEEEFRGDGVEPVGSSWRMGRPTASSFTSRLKIRGHVATKEFESKNSKGNVP